MSFSLDTFLSCISPTCFNMMNGQQLHLNICTAGWLIFIALLIILSVIF